MAVEEARALMAWCIAASKWVSWEIVKLDDVGPDRHGPTLRDKATTILSQSVVPGADALLELTTAEIEGLWRNMPDAVHMPDAVWDEYWPSAGSEILDRVGPARADRIAQRIRQWSLDPEGASADLQQERSLLRADPISFFDYRFGIGVQGLKPISDLPDPPSEYAERVAWFRERGIKSPRYKARS
ncbi:hypothetical protein [Microbacterium sp. LMI1x-1-1.1]|uniref:hypothetical protein n=1 Tax=Microbacterium sp. LMI1x-1-1.1 TaxID=3135246 RepID=UPI003424185C